MSTVVPYILTMEEKETIAEENIAVRSDKKSLNSQHACYGSVTRLFCQCRHGFRKNVAAC